MSRCPKAGSRARHPPSMDHLAPLPKLGFVGHTGGARNHKIRSHETSCHSPRRATTELVVPCASVHTLSPWAGRAFEAGGCVSCIKFGGVPIINVPIVILLATCVHERCFDKVICLKIRKLQNRREH